MGLTHALLLLVGPHGKFLQPIRTTTQIWVVTCHQYGISVLVSQTSFHQGTSGGVAKSQLFSQANHLQKYDVESYVLGPIDMYLDVFENRFIFAFHCTYNNVFRHQMCIFSKSVPRVDSRGTLSYFPGFSTSI